MSRTKIFISLILLFFYLTGFHNLVTAQDDQSCTNRLEDVQEFFDNGRYNLIPGYTDDCLMGGFSKAERIAAYRLITITHLFLDELDKADSVYMLLLSEDPLRVPDPSVDPPDLVFLHDNFRTSPVYATKIFGGINYSVPYVIYNASLYPENQSDERYIASMGGVMGAGFEVNAIHGLSLGIEGMVSVNNIEYKNTFLSNEGVKAEVFGSIGYTENQFWLDVPVYLKYTFEKWKNRPYFLGGFSWNFLFRSQASGIEKKYNEKIADQDFTERKFEDPGYDIDETRNRINYGLMFGAGIMFKLEGINYLTVDVRYCPGMTSILDPTKRFTNDAQVIQYGTLVDDFRIDSFSLNIGFFLPTYKPKKISDNRDL